MSFTLQSATLVDVPALSSIFGTAFATDTHTQIKTAANGPNEMINGMKGAIISWIEKTDRCNVTKAVENDTDEIMGWVCWARFGYERSESPGDIDRQSIEQQEVNQDIKTVTQSRKTPLEELESITNDDMQHWIDDIMPDGSKCRYIVAIAVHPRYQKRGVGSALIRLGTDKADEEGVICWVQASEAGYETFKKHAFVVRKTLEVDLDKHAPVPPPEGKERWGCYSFRYMVRPSRGRALPGDTAASTKETNEAAKSGGVHLFY